MNEDYREVYDDVRAWAIEGTGNPSGSPVFNPYWEGFFRWVGTEAERAYDIYQAGIDPFIDDLKEWFGNTRTWILEKWAGLAAWLGGIKDYIMKLWNNLKDYLRGLANEILNFPVTLWAWVKWYWNEIVYYIWLLGHNIWKWVRAAWEEILDYGWSLLRTTWDWVKAYWVEIYDYIVDIAGTIWGTLREAWTEWYVEIEEWVLARWGWIKATFWPWITELWEWLIEKVKPLFDRSKARIIETWPSARGFLSGLLKDIWAYILKSVAFIRERYIGPAVDAIQQALSWLWEKFTWIISRAYEEVWDLAKGFAPVTPERSVQLAGLMFASAVGLGSLAHGIALSVEAIPNLKYMGVHYLSAFSARMGGFGAISTATMGVIAAVSLRTPFTYYVNSLLRPTIPDARMLIEFRAKREITLPQFRSYMKYHGYADQWIDKTDSWLWKDPRLFEILYLTDVTVPTEDWLKRKFERAGYEDVDVKYMVRTAQMRTTKSPRTYVMTALRRNYRHGFLTEHELTEGIEALEVAPDAIDWIKRAGELDNIYEVNSDLVTAYRTAYRNDLITEEDCAASLAALGLPPDRVDATVYLEWVRKTPSALKAERKEVEAQWREVQKKYTSVYIESFRRGLITEDQLAGYLIAIGIRDKVAKMTARHEAIKLLPKTKPEPMPGLVIPPPVKPPEYEE